MSNLIYFYFINIFLSRSIEKTAHFSPAREEICDDKLW